MTTRQLLAGRYELGRVLGRGGMARVHAAHDTLLERPVAVKMLLGHYREDRQFVDRFRREAQNAASLNHPNIVAVYDTGQHDGLPFIVMERVHGRSLQEAIADGGLTEDRTLEVCAEVCAALAYAHERGLVHRDVKPGNILLGEDGSVKVTDFGIARAATTETVTRTAAVLGTAAYLSPEQAQGQEVDARSDVYSLGVVLYETLTGRKPFDGGSAVTVAYQHVQEAPAQPREWDPDISEAAEAICLHAMAKNPANRYPDASAMRQDLLAARVGEQIAAPAVLRPQDTALLEPGPRDDRQVPTERSLRRRRLAGFAVLALLTVLATVFGVWWLGGTLGGGDAPTVTVPDVTNQTIPEATRNLDAQGLRASVAELVHHESIPENHVVRQDPSANTLVEPDTTVRLFVSSGPRQVRVPPIVGVPEDEARTTLREAGLVPTKAGTAFSDEHEAGRVIPPIDPEPGETVDEGTQVEYTVSAGEERVRVPPVENQTESAARFELRERGFEVLVLREFSEVVEEGIVIRQDPGAGTELEKGAQVTIVVSRGPQEEEQETPSPSPTGSPSPTEPGPTPDQPDGDGDGIGTPAILRPDDP